MDRNNVKAFGKVTNEDGTISFDKPSPFRMVEVCLNDSNCWMVLGFLVLIIFCQF